MRKFDTKVQYLKYKVLREVARQSWKDTLLENILDIPRIIVPGKEPTMRCCVYKERAILAERVRLAMGGSKDNPNDQFSERINSGIDAKHFIPIIKGMELVMTQGTERLSNVPGLKIAGKTGTAQNPHGRDHSVFACFAPSDKPQIAVFVLVENGGWGGVVAAPIATLMLEHYLKGETSRPDVEKNILTMKFY